jgi:hypothetical protein
MHHMMHHSADMGELVACCTHTGDSCWYQYLMHVITRPGRRPRPLHGSQQWGVTVCVCWAAVAALLQVVCRQLGYTAGVASLGTSAQAGLTLDDIGCNGTEPGLQWCPGELHQEPRLCLPAWATCQGGWRRVAARGAGSEAGGMWGKAVPCRAQRTDSSTCCWLGLRPCVRWCVAPQDWWPKAADLAICMRRLQPLHI